MHRHHTCLGLGAVALISAAAFSALPTPAHAAGPAIAFSTPTVMDPIHAAGEPTIQVSPASDGTVYGSAPTGTGTQRSLWEASADGGQTFRPVNQCTAGVDQVGVPPASCAPPNAVQSFNAPPGGGDTDMRLDSKGNNYFNDLYALACLRVGASADHGATTSTNTYGCNSVTTPAPNTRPDGADRQWLAIYEPALTGVTSTAPDKALGKVIYQEYNNLQTTQSLCSYWVKSSDGLNYSPANNNNGNFGCDGYPSVDQVTGKVFEASDGGNGTLQLNIGTPDASGNLTFLDDATGGATNLVTVAKGLPGSPADLFTVSSMDTGRNLHITYGVSGSVTGSTSTFQIFTTVATAATGWTKWATPVQVSQAPSNVNVFPWMVAGAPGRSDSVWYGTSTFSDPSTLATPAQLWNVYMSQVVWPLLPDGTTVDTTGTPTVSMVKVSPHPNHIGTICLQGTGCITSQGDRNLADFFTVEMDKTGAAEVMYDDTSNGLLETAFSPGAGFVDHAGGALITIARQSAGPGLLGTAVTGTSNATTSGMTNPRQDALYPVIGGTEVPGMQLTANQMALSADGKTLTVTMKVGDLSSTGVQNTATTVTGTLQVQYVTRWQMGNTIYYALVETTPVEAAAGQYDFAAGAAQSVDLCSVSACDPHVFIYPDDPTASTTGTVTCPATPSVSSPCTVSITVPAATVGSPTTTSILEEVGSYALAAAHHETATTNAQAQADNVPLEVDGICCFNFQASAPAVAVPESPWTPALAVAGVLLVVAGVARRRKSNSI